MLAAEVERWASQVGALVAPGGRFYIHDGHPLAWAMDDDVEQRLAWGYFEEAEPYVWDSDQTYTDATRPIEHGRTYEWNHSLGEIVNALIDHGLTIDRLAEHDWTVAQIRPWLVEHEPGRWQAKPGSPRLPLSFSLLAHRRP